VENIVYLVVGLAALLFIVTYFKCGECCACHTCGTKEKPAEPSVPEESTEETPME
jgi:uncharacterized membrane protein YuzA (DUF378 family)